MRESTGCNEASARCGGRECSARARRSWHPRNSCTWRSMERKECVLSDAKTGRGRATVAMRRSTSRKFCCTSTPARSLTALERASPTVARWGRGGQCCEKAAPESVRAERPSTVAAAPRARARSARASGRARAPRLRSARARARGLRRTPTRAVSAAVARGHCCGARARQARMSGTPSSNGAGQRDARHLGLDAPAARSMSARRVESRRVCIRGRDVPIPHGISSA